MSASLHGSVPAKRRRRFLPKRRFDARVLKPFEPVDGNQIQAYDHGDLYFERMIAAIDAASRTVDVEMYLWDPDDVGTKFVDALERAGRRGLRVRVLFDANGASGMKGPLRKVTDAGGDVRIFSPFQFRFFRRFLYRTHKKLLLLDGRRAFFGGAGFSRHWSGGYREEQPWHDRMFEIEGMAVDQLEDVFDADFSRWEPIGPVSAPRERRPLDSVPIGASVVRTLRGWPDARDFRTLLLDAVHGARERVWIGTPYFVPAWKLRRELRSAARRGVDVRVIHPSQNHAHPLLWYGARARYARSLRNGVKLHEFTPCFYHAKLAVIDRTLAITGSSNIDYWSWRRNAELDLAFTDAPTVDRIAGLFEADLARSRRVTPQDARIGSGLRALKMTAALVLEKWL